MRGRAWAGASTPRRAGTKGVGVVHPEGQAAGQTAETDSCRGGSVDSAGGRTPLRIPLWNGVARRGPSFSLVKCSEAGVFSPPLVWGISKQINAVEGAGQGRAVFPVL